MQKKPKILLIPAAGQSSRFKSKRPKYLWTTPNGKLLIDAVVEPLFQHFDKVIITILREHEEDFSASKQLHNALGYLETRLIVKVIDSSNSSVDTIRQTLAVIPNDAFVSIKDCDSVLNLEIDDDFFEVGSVAFVDIAHQDVQKLQHKSFLVCNSNGLIQRIEEKKVCSHQISVGMYSFHYDDLRAAIDSLDLVNISDYSGEFYVSHLIQVSVDNNRSYKAVCCDKFIDFGDLDAYYQSQRAAATIFCDIDGVLVKNRGQYTLPSWSDMPEPLRHNIEKVNKLVANGAYLVLTTSRPPDMKGITQKQLSDLGVKFHDIVMGLPHSPRILINDYALSNPYPSAVAISIARDSELPILRA